jgi:hypothetical protein
MMQRYNSQHVNQLNQRGGASLLAVVFASLLILVIVVSMASLMAGELRQAIDSESSVKAYYEGESAAEEASAYVRSSLVDGLDLVDINQDCNPLPSQFRPTLIRAENIPCVRIVAQGKLPPVLLDIGGPREQVKEFDLTGLNFDRLDISWGKVDSGAGGDPLLEATIINYKKLPSATDDNSSMSTVILNPSNTCASDPCMPLPSFPYAFPEPTFNELNPRVFRYPGTPEMQWHAVLRPGTPPSLGGEYNTVLRIRTRNESSRVLLKLFQGSSELTAIPLPDAVVDVTSTLGETHRRTQREVPIRSTTFPVEAIYSDTEICKDFILVTTPDYQRVFSRICEVGN